jgi:NAD(P)-dependent dehydrogenase (short-subunit alcohol dehydrogenase family)
VAEEEQVRAMVADTMERFGHLDILVNNAGTTRFIPHPDLDAVTDEVWDQILSVNLKGTFYCSRSAGQELRRSRGAIVNVASIAGLRAAGSSIPYGVSKAAVMQLTRGLAVALAPEVRVNAVAPGLVATRWFRESWGEHRAEEQEREVEAATPLRGVATAEHVAQAILGLLASDFVTGQTVVVDGGKSITY